jgi:hypothetical protein
MNKKYVKPELSNIEVMALENLSAFGSFDGFSSFASEITTYQFGSGKNAQGGNIA